MVGRLRLTGRPQSIPYTSTRHEQHANLASATSRLPVVTHARTDETSNRHTRIQWTPSPPSPSQRRVCHEPRLRTHIHPCRLIIYSSPPTAFTACARVVVAQSLHSDRLSSGPIQDSGWKSGLSPCCTPCSHTRGLATGI